MRVAVALLPAASAAPIPATMRAVQASGEQPCTAPDWPCLSVQTVPTPSAGPAQALIQVRGSSVNPVDVDRVDPSAFGGCGSLPPMMRCAKGTIGSDVTGVVVAVGLGCSSVKVGDAVWGGVGTTFVNLGGAYAEYAAVYCAELTPKPEALSFADAGTFPGVAAASYDCLQKAGAPWTAPNLTVAVTSGQGGTGFIALQLARAFGATRLVTAASGDGIPLVKSLGADLVIDYKVQEIFDALPDDSVDIVYDNYGRSGTADKAMHAIRPGGVYVILEGGQNQCNNTWCPGSVSDHPKEGVTQIKYGIEKPTRKMMETVARFTDEGLIKPATMRVYGFDEVAEMWTTLQRGSVLGKLAIVPNKTA